MAKDSGLHSRQKELVKFLEKEKLLLGLLEEVRQDATLQEKQIKEYAALQATRVKSVTGKESGTALGGEIERLLLLHFNGEEAMAEKALVEKVKGSLVSSGRSLQGWAKAWKSALAERCEVTEGG